MHQNGVICYNRQTPCEDEPREGGPGRHGADGRSPFLLSTETCVATEGTQEWFTVNGEFSEGKCALFGKCRIFGLRPKILTLFYKKGQPALEHPLSKPERFSAE